MSFVVAELMAGISALGKMKQEDPGLDSEFQASQVYIKILSLPAPPPKKAEQKQHHKTHLTEQRK